MSCVLVKVLNAISPPTCRREARSMATAPPSDQPPAMIREGGKPRENKRLVCRLGRLAATNLRSLAAAQAIAQIIGNQHVQAQSAEAIELELGVGQAHRVAVEVDQGRPRQRIGVRTAVR